MVNITLTTRIGWINAQKGLILFFKGSFPGIIVEIYKIPLGPHSIENLSLPVCQISFVLIVKFCFALTVSGSGNRKWKEKMIGEVKCNEEYTNFELLEHNF